MSRDALEAELRPEFRRYLPSFWRLGRLLAIPRSRMLFEGLGGDQEPSAEGLTTRVQIGIRPVIHRCASGVCLPGASTGMFNRHYGATPGAGQSFVTGARN